MIHLQSGEIFEVPRYGGAGSPLVCFEGDLDYMAPWAGESVETVNEIKPAAEIVRTLAEDAAAALDQLGR